MVSNISFVEFLKLRKHEVSKGYCSFCLSEASGLGKNHLDLRFFAEKKQRISRNKLVLTPIPQDQIYFCVDCH